MKKAVFLDRDGTINVDAGYVHTPDKFILLPGVVEGLRLLQEDGYLLVIITNQSGINRGIYSEDEYLKFQSWIDSKLRQKGIVIAGQYYCPHVDSDNCICRKPKLGLFERAISDLCIDLKQSYAIGDKYRDLAICEKSEVKGFLIGENVESENIAPVSSLLEAAKIIHERLFINGDMENAR